MKNESLILRPLVREEVSMACEWAAAEGWNPGLHDAEVFWKTDPKGFLGMELEGELIGTGSIVSYEGKYGFMGFFIVKKEFRGKGYGTRFWYHRCNLLRSRLRPEAAIGMDGVLEMKEWYAKGGFQFSHDSIRMEGIAQKSKCAKEVVDLSDVSFHQILEYDRKCFGCNREGFLKNWIAMPNALALGFLKGGQLLGIGVIRSCRVGFKIGPLFADSQEVGNALFESLSDHAAGKAIFLDIPEVNPLAMDLAKNHRMERQFVCARMYMGQPKTIAWEKIFGITTFELG